MKELVRLDLGWNELEEIPEQISELPNLEQLWINDNPLVDIHPNMCRIKKLKVVDLSNTWVKDLPRELGRLKHLVTFDLRNTPLRREKLQRRADSVEEVLAYLEHKDQRLSLKQQLNGELRERLYREIADGEDATQMIWELVLEVFTLFKDNAEVKNVIRNCDRLFDPILEKANARDTRKLFEKLRRENDMKKLAADLELRMRTIYFDRIDPQKVEGIVHGIYDEIRDLDDIKFLIKWAPTIFPAESADIRAVDLRDNLVALQEKLARERANATAGLFKGLTAYYSDTEPKEVTALTGDVEVLFTKTEEIKTLTSDVNLHFPPDFLDAVPEDVRRSFVADRKAKKMGGTGATATIA